jgi:hypothetical protein
MLAILDGRCSKAKSTSSQRAQAQQGSGRVNTHKCSSPPSQLRQSSSLPFPRRLLLPLLPLSVFFLSLSFLAAGRLPVCVPLAERKGQRQENSPAHTGPCREHTAHGDHTQADATVDRCSVCGLQRIPSLPVLFACRGGCFRPWWPVRLPRRMTMRNWATPAVQAQAVRGKDTRHEDKHIWQLPRPVKGSMCRCRRKNRCHPARAQAPVHSAPPHPRQVAEWARFLVREIHDRSVTYSWHNNHCAGCAGAVIWARADSSLRTVRGSLWFSVCVFSARS